MFDHDTVLSTEHTEYLTWLIFSHFDPGEHRTASAIQVLSHSKFLRKARFHNGGLANET